ncbi:MAG TPA: hypothetical protein VIX37_06800 [Candidatus Sulfotelmatobacter sp.]
MKFLPEELANDAQALERFRREAALPPHCNDAIACSRYRSLITTTEIPMTSQHTLPYS